MDQTTPGGITPQSTQPSSPEPSQQNIEVHVNETKQSSLGPVIGIVIIIILLIAGALYAWKSMPQNTIPSNTLATEQTDSQTTQLMEVTTSTNPVDIETDLNNTDIENLDADIETLLIETTQ